MISWRQIGLTVRDGLREIMPIFIISVMMGLMVFFCGKMLNGFTEIQSIKLIVLVLCGFFLYFGLIRMKYGKLQILLSELKR